jgi:TRAP-type C4-dicarboxylate transport system permease large subunit
MKMFDFFKTYTDSPFVFLLLLNLFLLVVGCLMDIFSALIVVVPLIMPIAQAYGIHPVHLGIIFLTNLQIGASTPPVGMNLFISSLRFEKPMAKIIMASLPFIALLLITLIFITYIPWLSLALLK